MNYWTHEIHTLARVGETTLPPPDPTPPKAIFAERKQVRPDGHAVACVLVYTTVGQASSIDCLLGCEVSPVSVFRPKGINTYPSIFWLCISKRAALSYTCTPRKYRQARSAPGEKRQVPDARCVLHLPQQPLPTFPLLKSVLYMVSIGCGKNDSFAGPVAPFSTPAARYSE